MKCNISAFVYKFPILINVVAEVNVGHSGKGENSLSYGVSNSDLLVVRLVASRYTDYAAVAHIKLIYDSQTVQARFKYFDDFLTNTFSGS
jgi:hypothetical protein